MTPFTSISGPAAPLMAENVNTDVIIRIERLASLKRDELGPYAFEAWRYGADGAPEPDFVLNQPAWEAAPILLAGENFGCGSSREGAVWVLNARGIRVVIAPSFGSIFQNNCYQNGTLPVVLPAETVAEFAEIARAQPEAPFTVDLERQVVVPPNGAPVPFEIDRRRREALLRGQDDIAQSLDRLAEIAAFQAADRERRPWVHRITDVEAE
ncbi:MAG: 3-isopropylmalate dehydratase small subunit [Xanthomonadales bacterium]|nr:3-isopropylmalate dehydratase small subunit [Xanthomonadales bacterium]